MEILRFQFDENVDIDRYFIKNYKNENFENY